MTDLRSGGLQQLARHLQHQLTPLHSADLLRRVLFPLSLADCSGNVLHITIPLRIAIDSPARKGLIVVIFIPICGIGDGECEVGESQDVDLFADHLLLGEVAAAEVVEEIAEAGRVDFIVFG